MQGAQRKVIKNTMSMGDSVEAEVYFPLYKMASQPKNSFPRIVVRKIAIRGCILLCARGTLPSPFKNVHPKFLCTILALKASPRS